MRTIKGSIMAISAALAAAGPTLADPPAASKAVTLLQDTPANPGLFTFNYGADGSPALNLLGLSPSKVQVANTLTPFALSVPSLFSGSAGQSIGLDIAPAYALQDIWPISLQTYQTHGLFNRILIRSHVEVAAANGAASTDATKLQQSGLAIAYATSLLDNSDPVALDGGAKYFDACIDPVTPLIKTGLAQLNNDSSITNSIPAKLTGDLATITDFSPNDAYLRQITPKIFEEYTSLFGDDLPKDFPVGRPAELPTTYQALAAMRDIFTNSAKADPGDVAGAAQALAYAQEVDDLADGPLPPASGSASTERSDVARFVIEAKIDGKLKRTLQRLMATPQFGVPNPAAAASSDLLAQQVAWLKDKDKLKAMVDKAKTFGDQAKATYKQQLGNDIFMRLGVTQKVSDCVKATATLAAASSDLSVGLGYVEAGAPGAFSHFHDGGEAVWLAGRVPIWRWFSTTYDAKEVGTLAKGNATYLMLGGSLNYINRASVTTGKTATPIMDANVFSAWVGLQGYSDFVRGSVQGGYTSTRAVESSNSALSTNGWRWETSASLKVYDGIWLGASYGTANGSTAKLDDKTFLLTLSFSTPTTTSVFGSSRAPSNTPTN